MIRTWETMGTRRISDAEQAVLARAAGRMIPLPPDHPEPSFTDIGAAMTRPEPARLTDAGDGVHLHPDQIAATYRVAWFDGDAWTDIPEARPRCRVRVDEGAAPVTIVVDTDGHLHHAKDAGLVTDRYPGEDYADVRAEGRERWRRVNGSDTDQPDDVVRPQVGDGSRG